MEFVQQIQALLPGKFLHHGRVVRRHEAVQAVKIALSRNGPVEVGEIAVFIKTGLLPLVQSLSLFTGTDHPGLKEPLQKRRIRKVVLPVAARQQAELLRRQSLRLFHAVNIVRIGN